MAQDQNLQGLLHKSRREAEEREAERRAKNLNLPYIDLTTKPVETDALELIPELESMGAQAATIEKKGDRVVFVALDPSAAAAQKWIKDLEAKGLRLIIFTVSLSSLERAWSFYKYVAKKTGPITGRIDIDKERISELMKKLTSLAVVREEISNFDIKNFPTAQVLEIVLAGALSNRASDIHFEPTREAVRLRYRIDGDLEDAMDKLDRNIYDHLISRIKLLSNLKLNVRDETQDGRFTIGAGAKEIEIRVAIAPSEFGEVIVMRVLDPDAINLSLKDLGLREDDLKIIETELRRPNGMVLNTGPTGSGKTTTLYAFLQYKRSPENKIITIEDPIEYHLSGIEQTQVDSEAKYTFDNGLRSIMRQDPDIILIGEVRDVDTATIAIQAALTGHLVFSTVHANQAAGAIPRLVDLGVKPTSIGPAINLIIAQRLVKRLCKDCETPAAIGKEEKNLMEKLKKSLPKRVDVKFLEKPFLYKPKEGGCAACGGNSYRGRIGIYELLQVTKPIEALLQKAPDQSPGEFEIQEAAIKGGMVTLQQDGLLKVFSGVTTIEEVEKVTGPLSI